MSSDQRNDAVSRHTARNRLVSQPETVFNRLSPEGDEDMPNQPDSELVPVKSLAEAVHELGDHSNAARRVFAEQQVSPPCQLGEETRLHIKDFLTRRRAEMRKRDIADQAANGYPRWRGVFSALGRRFDEQAQRFGNEIRKQIPDFRIDWVLSVHWYHLEFGLKTSDPLEAAIYYSLRLELATGCVSLYAVPANGSPDRVIDTGAVLDAVDEAIIGRMLDHAFQFFVSGILQEWCR